ncbi:hypothetical protein DQ384_09415 [Sphaerisporangium album]|uniref:Uncharacterized protein n=1 Tax=Sphaerisporangium album TaxID=509200 RepID=A0A367FPW9_9ACTN|nr:hypothetical protein [Sphaerisporangium album]RCG31747.1 hypothetical protein DQ384_09415 [Sphaerisporangium album]
MTSPAPRGSRRRRPVLVPVTALLATAAVAVTAAFGGLGEAPSEGPERRQAGQEVDQDLFRTRIADAVTRTLPGDDRPFVEMTLKVYNEAESSVPLPYLEKSLLRITTRDGERLIDPSVTPGEQTWVYELWVPGEGGSSRILPPKRTSTVLLRLIRKATPEERAAGAGPDAASAKPAPSLLDVDLGLYENHEDALTGRHRAQLVIGDDGEPEIAARVTVLIRKQV